MNEGTPRAAATVPAVGERPPPDGRHHEVAQRPTSADSRMPGQLAELAGGVVEARVAGEDEHPEDPQRAPGAGKRDRDAGGPPGGARGPPASRGMTNPRPPVLRSCTDATGRAGRPLGSRSRRSLPLRDTPRHERTGRPPPPGCRSLRVCPGRAGGWPATGSTTRPSTGAGCARLAAAARLQRLHAVRARRHPGHQHQRARHRIDGARDPVALLDRIDPGPGVRLRGEGADRWL